jgi:D-serine deaminase-like pyridoxal phosphate-dependent protein
MIAPPTSRVLADDAPFRVDEVARVLTPALVIHRELVAQNIATTLRLLDGDAARWRPHVKTAKLAYVMRMLVDAGVRQFKCATSLELRVACEAGAADVLVAFPLVGPAAARVRSIADEHPRVRVSVLAETPKELAPWRGSRIAIFVDVNPGMDRTGIPQERGAEIVALCRAIAAAGLTFGGLHYYDGHLSKYEFDERMRVAPRGYDRLLQIVGELRADGIAVPEIITAGTPAFPCSLAYAPFRGAGFVHRISPGTVVYCDTTALAQLPEAYGYSPAAVVMTRVISHPAADRITCDAGHKTVSADSGVPTCRVLGHPELEPLTPSEEHLPMRVAAGSARPAIGDVLYLVPRHVCPSVNNFDHALIVRGGKVLGVEPVSARGREKPL